MSTKTFQDQELREIVGGNLRSLRENRGLGQKHIADFFNTTKTTVSHWEKGRNEASYSVLKRLSELYETPIDNFFKREA